MDPDPPRPVVGVGIVLVGDVGVEQAGGAPVEGVRVGCHRPELPPEGGRVRLHQGREGALQRRNDELGTVRVALGGHDR